MHRAVARLFIAAWVTAAAVLPGGAHAFTPVYADDVAIWGVGPAPDSDVNQPACTLNPVNDHYALAWSQDDGDAGFRVYVAAVNAPTGTAAVFPSQVDLPFGNARQPAIAFSQATQRYLVVWSQDADPASPGAYEIWARMLTANLLPFSPPFRISRMGALDSDPHFDAVTPGVAAGGSDGSFLVVWAGDDEVQTGADGVFQVFARRIDGNGTVAGVVATKVSTLAGPGGAHSPAVGYDTHDNRYLVAYEGDRDGDALYEPEIYTNLVDANGAELAPAYRDVVVSVPLGGSEWDAALARNPDIAFDNFGHRFLIVWDGTTLDLDEPGIYARGFAAGAAFGAPFRLSADLPAGAGACVARDPAAVFNVSAGKFVVLWSGSAAGGGCPGDREVLGVEQPRDFSAATAPQVLSSMGPAGDPEYAAVSPAIVASQSGAPMMALWSGYDQTDWGHFSMWGQFLTTPPATAALGPIAGLPTRLQLSAAPNPFNPRTVVHFGVPQAGHVRLTIHDLRGALVRVLADAPFAAGWFDRPWNGDDDRGRRVASGVYLVQIEGGGDTQRAKLLLLK